MASNPDNDRLFVRYRTGKPKQDHYSLVLNGNDSFRQLKTVDYAFDSVGYSVVGGCNGLICLSDYQENAYRDNMFLWNPSIRKFLLCLDIISVEIYTLKTDRWRYISEKALPVMITERYRQAYVNGAAHWMAFHQGTLLTHFRYSILSFNTSDEIFSEILVPDSITYEGSLVVLEESLCLFQQCVDDNDRHYSVWIMKEYGVATSWAKLFIIDHFKGLCRPLGSRRNGEVIFSTRGEDLVSCDYQSKQISYLGIHGTSGDGYSKWHAFYTDTYAESLVLLNYLG
ncbi:hypothetical protein RHMOL_Rhmol05G0031700 [Rhododendron molle]|uniref:Uncharacterized protein n=1 Tax=Rhododendron molle TaxID=49168 RepID=A0ACC0NJV8_RHOML|nr:hypothetical protein RHMOL_Rhmol05G0031700 [Rhododendron molle]